MNWFGRLLTCSTLFVAAFDMPVIAQDFRHADRDRGEGYARETGGYCDRYGCPDHFWRYPVHYGPVFVHGRWLKGPVYFRGNGWERQYWVLGDWHRDEWRGPRPWWARQSHDGPPLSFDFYANHGFVLGDHWRHEHDTDQSDYGFGDHGSGDRIHGDWRDQNSGDWHGQSGSEQGANDRGGDQNGHGGAPDQRSGDRQARNGDRGAGINGAPPGGANVITVTSATYGASCHQPNGNVTKFLADACNGKSVCNYAVQYQTIGDPSPGCSKDFSVQWSCSAGPGGSQSLPGEAGFGGKVALQCGGRP